MASFSTDATVTPFYGSWEVNGSYTWPSENFKPLHDYFGLSDIVRRLSSEESCATAAAVQNGSNVASQAAVTDENIFHDFRNNGRESLLTFTPLAMDAVMEESRPRSLSLRTSRLLKPHCAPSWCVFCKNNGESEMVFASHILKDGYGKITCPILRAYICPLCGASGDYSHTIKYCPTTKGEFPPAPLKTARTSTGWKRPHSTQSSQTSMNDLFM